MNRSGQPAYLDYNATTPIDPAVREAMLPFLDAALGFGNPSSGHAYGTRAKEAVEKARAQLAALLSAAPDEVAFTGSGSEADNLAIKGVAFAHRERGDHIITCQIEHPAVLETCRYLERRFGYRVTYLPVDHDGLVDPEAVGAAITDRTILVTVMLANNETGTLEPVADIARVAHQRGILVHTDAAQAVGKVPVDVDALGVDLLTVVGHKLYAPKGIGALYVRRGTVLDSLVHGAGHEGGLRAGTEAVAAITGLGAAAELAQRLLPTEGPRSARLRDRMEAALHAAGWVSNGHPARRLPNTLNISLPGADGEDLLHRAPEIAASTGAACHSGRTEPSQVLLALGIPWEQALGAVRLSLGRWTTEDEVDQAAAVLIRAGNEALQGGPA